MLRTLIIVIEAIKKEKTSSNLRREKANSSDKRIKTISTGSE